MSGNDFSRCERCGAVWLDKPKPCECVEYCPDCEYKELRIKRLLAENKRLKEGLAQIVRTGEEWGDLIEEAYDLAQFAKLVLKATK